MKRLSNGLKALAYTIGRFASLHKLITAAAVIILMVILIIVFLFSCSGHHDQATETTTDYFDAAAWKENENGFKYYDHDGYQNEFGIDISEWVEEVDFQKAASSGIDFVILRVGYRGYETGKFVLDNNLSVYLKDASSAGLRMGAYFVSQAINTQEAIEEAEYVMKHISGYSMEMPLYIDLETVYDTARTDHLTAEDYTAIVNAFCETVEERGYRGGVYTNDQWLHEKLEFRNIEQFDIWIAQYADTLSTDLPVNMWQFTNEGLIEGCDMWVDLNVRVTKELPPEEADAEIIN